MLYALMMIVRDVLLEQSHVWEVPHGESKTVFHCMYGSKAKKKHFLFLSHAISFFFNANVLQWKNGLNTPC
jgi:hypothetical protein